MNRVPTTVTQIGLALLPGAIEWAKQWWADTHPTAPPLTDAQVKAALAVAGTLSIATDDAWLAAHPLENDTP